MKVEYLIVCDYDLERPMASATRAIVMAQGLSICSTVALFSFAMDGKMDFIKGDVPIRIYNYSDKYCSPKDFFESVIREVSPKYVIYRDRVHSSFKIIFNARIKYDFKVIMDLGENPWGVFLNKKWFSIKTVSNIFVILNELFMTTMIEFHYYKKTDAFFIINPAMLRLLPTQKTCAYVPLLIWANSPGQALPLNYEKYFVYIGSQDIKKDDLLTLLKAFRMLTKKYSDYHLVMTGNPSKQLRELIRKMGLENIVVSTGFLEEDEISLLVGNSTACILTKKDSLQNRYNFPTKLLQYIVYGSLLVCSDYGILKYYFRDNENALTYSPGNDLSLAEALEKSIILNPVQKQLLAKNLKSLSATKFNASHIMGETNEFVKKIMKE